MTTSNSEVKGQTVKHSWQITILKDSDVHYTPAFRDGAQGTRGCVMIWGFLKFLSFFVFESRGEEKYLMDLVLEQALFTMVH